MVIEGVEELIVNTHILLASRIYDNLLPQTEISNIDKTCFMFGSIKPDLVSLVSYRPHRMKDSLNFLLNEVNQLLYPKKQDIESFSTSLGLVTHYLSDFFCRPHNHREEFNGFLDHMRYEFSLHSICKVMDSCELLAYEKLNIDYLLNLSLGSQIQQLNSEYQNLNPNIQNDILYATKASTLGLYYILNNTLFEFSKEFVA